jgi:hypothetical protein
MYCGRSRCVVCRPVQSRDRVLVPARPLAGWQARGGQPAFHNLPTLLIHSTTTLPLPAQPPPTAVAVATAKLQTPHPRNLADGLVVHSDKWEWRLQMHAWVEGNKWLGREGRGWIGMPRQGQAVVVGWWPDHRDDASSSTLWWFSQPTASCWLVLPACSLLQLPTAPLPPRSHPFGVLLCASRGHSPNSLSPCRLRGADKSSDRSDRSASFRSAR